MEQETPQEHKNTLRGFFFWGIIVTMLIATPSQKMEHKLAHLSFRSQPQVLPAWWEVARMSPGVARRQLMTQILLHRRAQGDTLPAVRVNDRHVLPSSDPDLQVLVRRGILLRRRVSSGGRKRNTELHLADRVVA
jgi:hypothetical protein